MRGVGRGDDHRVDAVRPDQGARAGEDLRAPQAASARAVSASNTPARRAPGMSRARRRACSDPMTPAPIRPTPTLMSSFLQELSAISVATRMGRRRASRRERHRRRRNRHSGGDRAPYRLVEIDDCAPHRPASSEARKFTAHTRSLLGIEQTGRREAPLPPSPSSRGRPPRRPGPAFRCPSAIQPTFS